MSWLYSRALVEAYSEGISLDGAPSALSSETRMPLAYCARDKMTAFSRLSRFGTTFAPLTDDRGKAVLTSFLAAFPAKTSAQQEMAPESTESEAGFGEKWRALSARFDRVSSSWKTARCLFAEALPWSSVTLPRWGMMHGGECWERDMPEPLTSETESGSLLPTPTAQQYGTRNNGKRGDGSSFRTAGAPSLATMARKNMWPTPTAGDAKSSGSRNTANSKAHHGVSLTDAVRNDGGTGRTEGGGPLNPTWVEWLMGWPLEWTALEPLVMDKYQQWRRLHGDY